MSKQFEDAIEAAYAAVDYSIPAEMVEAAIRAALTVLREPPEAVVEAGQKENNLSEYSDIPGHFEFLSRDEMTAAWQAMVDELLK